MNGLRGYQSVDFIFRIVIILLLRLNRKIEGQIPGTFQRCAVPNFCNLT